MVINFYKLAKIAGSTLLYLIVFDILGVLVIFAIEILSIFSDNPNMPVSYAMWFTMGVFCGLFSYNTGGNIAARKPETDPAASRAGFMDWSNREDSGRIGLLVLGITAFVLAALSAVFVFLGLGSGTAPSGYVPDSRPLTITFFVSVFAASLFAHHSFRSAPKQTA